MTKVYIFIGATLQAISLIGIMIALIIFGLLEDGESGRQGDNVIYEFGLFAAFGILMLTFYSGKRIARKGRKHSKLIDKDFILFLRNFKEDRILAKGEEINWIQRVVFFGGTIDLKTEEEEIEMALSCYGKFIGIGKPGEYIPRLGAERLYFNDDEWQVQVKYFMDKATLLLMISGKSKGLLWEMETIIKSGLLRKLVIIIPNKDTGYKEYKRKFEELTMIKLPDIDFNSKGRHTYRGIIWFDNDIAKYETCQRKKSFIGQAGFILNQFLLMKFRFTAALDFRQLLHGVISKLNIKRNNATIASIIKRLKAAGLDFIIITPMIYLTYILLQSLNLHEQIFNFLKEGHPGDLIEVAFPLTITSYFLIFEFLPPNATPGKRIMKLYIADKEGIGLTYMQSSFRLFLKMITFMLLIGIFYLIKNKKMLHDVIINTNVFENKVELKRN
jgi:uncharacterized RDD family membrane protein YckC